MHVNLCFQGLDGNLKNQFYKIEELVLFFPLFDLFLVSSVLAPCSFLLCSLENLLFDFVCGTVL